MSDHYKKFSKSLSYWLRHRPDAANLQLDEAGWASVESVLAAFEAKNANVDFALLKQIVDENDKQRFEISEDESRIRARQGHSIEVKGSWVEKEPPPILYHGTVEKFLASIMAQGLTKQNRHHVHLSPDIETARKVGSRRGEPVILQIDSSAMVQAGYSFALSTNNVWLVEAVPPNFLSKLQE